MFLRIYPPSTTSKSRLVCSQINTTRTNIGWDSAFEYEGQTYAEMPKVEKNKISHRGKALEKLKRWLKGGDIEVAEGSVV